MSAPSESVLIQRPQSPSGNVDLVYKVEKRGRALLVRLQQKGSRKILYLDTLKAIAKESDKEALQLLVKIHRQTSRNLETLSFEKIEVPPTYVDEALRLMGKTGRLVCEMKEEPAAPATIVTTPEPPAPRVEPPPLELKPRLVLKDASGCFADLWFDYAIGVVSFDDFAPMVRGRSRLKKEESSFERDLLEAGFIRKIVGNSHYYCPSDRVQEALRLLIDVGWQVHDPFGVAVNQRLEVREENGRVILKGPIRGLLDQKIQMGGVWEGNQLVLKRSQIGSVLPLLSNSNVIWDEQLKSLAEGLSSGAAIEKVELHRSFRGELLPYQQKGVDWLQFLYKWGFSALLADEMGLGKTVQVLAFLSQLRTNLPVLIVAPTSLLFNWRAEIAKFLPEFSNFELISYAALRSAAPEKEYEVIILDESNAIKTATTQTARAACKLKGHFKICISGTPMENRHDEIWSQFHFLMPDLIDRNLETLKQQIRPFILRRKKEEVALDLPEKIEQITWVEMTDAQKELYETYKQGIRLDGVSKMQILESILRLRQIVCDPRLVGSDAPSAKFEQLIADLQEVVEAGRKVLVFSQFASMLKLIHKEFPEALLLDGATSEKERERQVREFQEVEGASIFLLSLKAGGVGLNLTAADFVFLFDPWWNEAVERQAIDRAHRIGQKKTVIAKRYMTASTIEEKILQLKAKKLQAADQLLDADGLSQEELIQLLV